MDSSGPAWSSGLIREAVKAGRRSEVVRLTRLARGWTQSQLGKRCGYSPSVISRLESGAQPLSDIKVLKTLAEALEIPPEFLGLTPDSRSEGGDGQTAIPRPRSQSPAVRAPAQLPMDLPEFAGRDAELRQLDGLLVSHRKQQPTAVVISAVSGTAGIGKTALAVHWAHRIADRFRDGQLYVNLRGFEPSGIAMDPAEAMRGFLEALGVEPKSMPAELEAQAALYRSLLSGRRMLVVLDNARDVNQARHLLPGTSGCLVIVTSRNTLSGLVTRQGARPLRLDLLPGTEALQLLERRLTAERVASEPIAAAGIVAACAGLPLALAVVASRAEMHPDFSLASLASELEDRIGRLDVLSEEADTDVRALFSWSYQQLDQDAKRLFRLLGLHPGPSASAAAIASLAGISGRLARVSLTELTRAHLVTERTRGRFELHDLLRAYAYEINQSTDADADRRSAIQRMLDHYLHSAFAADRLLRPGREAISLAPHQFGVVPERVTGSKQAMEWFVAEHRVLLAVLEQAFVAGVDRAASDLTWTLDTYLDRRGHYRDHAKVWSVSLEATRRLGDRQGQARAHRMLAHANRALGRLDDAGVHLQHALGILADLDDVIGQAKAYGTLAWVHEQRGDCDRALSYAQLASELYRAAGDQDGHARAMNDTGWYQALLGEYGQALLSCEQALAMHQQLGNSEAEANTLDSLGYIHFRRGKYQQAIDCYRRAHSLFAELDDRHNWAVSLDYLGETQLASGDPAAAQASWEHALAIFEELDLPGAATIRTKLAELGQTLADAPDAGQA